MVRAANGTTLSIEGEPESCRIMAEDGLEREWVPDPWEMLIRDIFREAVDAVKEAANAVEPFDTVDDFLYFADPQCTKRATDERVSARMTLLEQASDALDWLITDEPEEGVDSSDRFTFVQGCQALGADVELTRGIIINGLTSRWLTPQFGKKLHDYLNDVVGE